MPCKHEGGTDPCLRSQWGHCLLQKQRHSKSYARDLVSAVPRDGKGSVYGAAAEKLVAAFLLSRGLHVWEPAFESGKHDLFFESGSVGWTVQVRMGRLNKRTGILNHHNSGKGRLIISDLTALVWLPDNTIRWINNTDRELPEELK